MVRSSVDYESCPSNCRWLLTDSWLGISSHLAAVEGINDYGSPPSPESYNPLQDLHRQGKLFRTALLATTSLGIHRVGLGCFSVLSVVHVLGS